jgi:hypothetical protein
MTGAPVPLGDSSHANANQSLVDPLSLTDNAICTGCLLEALDPFTIPEPTGFKDYNSTTVITTATVIRSTTYYVPPSPIPYEVNYYTSTVTATLAVPTSNDTHYSTLSTSVYTFSGVPL